MMQGRSLLIITTRLPPQICGVGSFSWQLEQHWPGDNSQHRFLVVDGADASARELGNIRVVEFGEDWSALRNALDQSGASNVLLHYAGHGYQRFGCPTRLLGILRDWKTKFPCSRLSVFFHEVPGRPSFGSKRYLFDVCSRRIAGKIADVADLIITNTPEHARVLEAISRHRNIRCLAVPSNVEPSGPIPEQRTRTEFVIFGLPFGRWQTLEAFHTNIQAWQKTRALSKLHLIGPADNKFDARSELLLASYPNPGVVIKHGELSAPEISQILSRARFAFTTATDSNWSKSGSLMAFLAHGCVVVSNSRSSSGALSFAVTPEQVTTLADAELEAKAVASRRWYEENANWRTVARTTSELIFDVTGK